MSSAADPAHVAEEIQEIQWYHSIRLGDVVTPGVTKENDELWLARAIPSDLRYKTVLDIGAWDGFFSFLCEKRGASRVLAIDDLSGVFSWGMNSNKGFQLAKKILHSHVEFRQMSVYDLTALEENFDIVVFFGVYYHLKNPLEAFETISSKTKELLVVEGHVNDDQRPVMYLYDPYELNPQDATNYWGPSIPCLEKMLRRVGFGRIRLIDRIADRVLFQAWKQ
jgi:tRNA (mo5U34)-methyltransferase